MTKKRRVLVTGASGGIGSAVALGAATLGFDVTVHYNSNLTKAEACVEKIKELGGDGNLLQFDISDRAATREILEAQVEAHGAYYGVVCNAGFNSDGAFPALTDEQWDRVVHNNLDGFYNVLHPLVMPMIRLRSGGRIITMASVSGIIGNRGQTNYSAAKAGIIGATKALSTELAKRKITVNCVAPGLIDTDMTAGPEEEMILGAIPLRRKGTPTEVAAATDFLLSDQAGYITRQVISVNGGLC